VHASLWRLSISLSAAAEIPQKLAMIFGIAGYFVPRDGDPLIGCTAILRRNPGRFLQRFKSYATQAGQFRAWLLCGGTRAKSG
jgi:hypothetical protein